MHAPPGLLLRHERLPPPPLPPPPPFLSPLSSGAPILCSFACAWSILVKVDDSYVRWIGAGIQDCMGNHPFSGVP